MPALKDAQKYPTAPSAIRPRPSSPTSNDATWPRSMAIIKTTVITTPKPSTPATGAMCRSSSAAQGRCAGASVRAEVRAEGGLDMAQRIAGPWTGPS